MTPKKDPKDLKKRGRKTLYKVSYNETVRKLCLLGATDEEIADILGHSLRVINKWKKDYPKFMQSIQKGKKIADAEIANSLYNRAKGYSHKDVHISNFQGKITMTNITKHYPPDTAAAFIWLKNRQGKLWKDKQQIEHSGEVVTFNMNFGEKKAD